MKFQFILLLTCSATFSRPLHNEADVVEHRLDISHAAVTENNETRKDRVVREADDFGKGFLEQLKETGDSIETLIRHPITTVKNLANATMHPVQTVKNLKAYLSNCTDISNCAGRVVSFGVTLGLSEGLGEIAEAASIGTVVANGAKAAAQGAHAAEANGIITNANEKQKAKVDAD